jgi:catalase
MSKTSKQEWTAGSTVKVGFLTLVVVAKIATPGDFKPDAYILKNSAGTQLYKHVPFNGVEKLSVGEAQALIAAQEEAAARATYRALAKAKADAATVAAINALTA